MLRGPIASMHWRQNAAVKAPRERV